MSYYATIYGYIRTLNIYETDVERFLSHVSESQNLFAGMIAKSVAKEPSEYNLFSILGDVKVSMYDDAHEYDVIAQEVLPKFPFSALCVHVESEIGDPFSVRLSYDQEMNLKK